MENVTHILQIYKSCDPNNTDAIPASSLLNFIKPFMSDDLSELDNLQVQLDPNGSDPPISSAFFHQIMSDWIAKIDKQECVNNGSENDNKEEMNLTRAHSSIFTLGLSPNLSRISTNSINNNTIVLEEQIQKLQQQLYKTSNELDLIKQQLVFSEEQNESLSVELKLLHKLHYREQQVNEEIIKSKQENEEIKEEANDAIKRIQQLDKNLLEREKQNHCLQTQINQLENENGYLKIKVQKLEKGRTERTKSIGALEYALDNKESEILTLMDMIKELQGKLDEKTELVNFYMNESKLNKQKVEDMENHIKEMFPDEAFTPTSKAKMDVALYNSPKLLNQIANPITPTIDSPLNFSKCTSSPIRNGHESIDLFKHPGMVTVLRSPHKSLKDELAEICNVKIDEGEVKRLQEVLKEQEIIKNNLWDGMKHLSQDNEVLREYKQGCEKLRHAIEEKDNIIKLLQNEVDTLKSVTNVSVKEDKFTETEYWHERDELIKYFNEELHEQTTVSGELAKTLEKERNKSHNKQNKSVETNCDMEKDVLQNLYEEINRLKESLEIEKQKCSLFKNKEMLNKCTETDKEDILWIVPAPEILESKKTNYAKQQMKLERLFEKQKKTEKELNMEIGLNRSLTLKVQELREENTQLKENLEFSKDIYHKLSETTKILEVERNDLQQENLKLTSEIFAINQQLQNNLNKLAVEDSVIRGLQMENEFFINRIRQLEINTKQECIKEVSLKKQVIGVKTIYDLKILELKKEISEKDNKIFKLQNQSVNLEWLLSEANNNLESITSYIQCHCKIEYEIDKSSLDFGEMENSLENTSALMYQIHELSNNIKLAIYLFKVMDTKCSSVSNEIRSPDETYNVVQTISSSSGDEYFDSHMDTSLTSIEDDQSFVSCLSEFSNLECLELIPFETDSFLETLELNDADLRNLSRKQMEDKFTSLALTLTIDFTTSNKRYLNQKEKCNQLFIKFFTYLNFMMALTRQLKPSSGKVKIDKTLQLLKNISEDIIKSAFLCGVIHYEKRTVNCWNLVINYVAVLDQESKQTKQKQGSNGSPNIIKTLTPTSISNQIRCTDNEFSLQYRI